MRRMVIAWGIFVLVTGFVMLCCSVIGNQTPVLKKGEPLPSDIGERHYAITAELFEVNEEGIVISFPVEEPLKEELTLTLSDVSDYSLQINGKAISSYDDKNIFSRIICIPLEQGLIEQKGKLELLFSGEDWRDEPNKNQTNVPKLLLCSTRKAQEALNISCGVTMLLIGAFLVLILSNLTLFFRKKTERYLLLLAGASGTVMVTTLLTSAVTLFPLRNAVYQAIRPHIVSFPLLVNASVCLSLMKESLPPWGKRFTHMGWLGGAMLLMIVATILTGKNLYHILTALMLFPVLASLGCGYREKKPGALLLLIGYAIWQGIALRIYAVNAAQIAFSGVIGVYFRITQLGHLAYLLACMMVINQRYARKFDESEQLNNLLDAKIEERTHQLMEEQEQRRAMMLNLFHDLRSPIFAIQGHLEKLKPAGTEENAVFDDIRLRMKFLQRLIEDLFLLSKLEDKKLRFDGDYVELHHLLEQQMGSAQLLAQRNGIKVSVTNLEPCLIWGDAMRLQQVIQNLLDNAIAYTPPEGEIFLSLTREAGNAVLSVSDTGEGISEKDLPWVFERYYHSSRAGNQKSTGLGLAIAKNLIELHRGSIEVESEEGRGTSFIIRLPLLQKD